MKQLGCWRKRKPHSGLRGQRATPLRQKRSWSSRLLGSGWALLLILIVGVGSFIAAPPASAQQAGTLTVSPTSGPVGTVVHISGTFGPGCTSENDFGVGALVRVQVVAGGPWQAAELTDGGSFESSDPLHLHFGLGPGVRSVNAIEVTWPGQTRPQTIRRVRADRYVTITRAY